VPAAPLTEKPITGGSNLPEAAYRAKQQQLEQVVEEEQQQQHEHAARPSKKRKVQSAVLQWFGEIAGVSADDDVEGGNDDSRSSPASKAATISSSCVEGPESGQAAGSGGSSDSRELGSEDALLKALDRGPCCSRGEWQAEAGLCSAAAAAAAAADDDDAHSRLAGAAQIAEVVSGAAAAANDAGGVSGGTLQHAQHSMLAAGAAAAGVLLQGPLLHKKASESSKQPCQHNGGRPVACGLHKGSLGAGSCCGGSTGHGGVLEAELAAGAEAGGVAAADIDADAEMCAAMDNAALFAFAGDL